MPDVVNNNSLNLSTTLERNNHGTPILQRETEYYNFFKYEILGITDFEIKIR